MTGVSVVIPVKNGAAYIRHTLESVWAQRVGPTEVIVVDDLSTDGSRQVVEEIATRLPISVISGTGRGAAAALNVGVRIARHPIVCQVDQDVVLQPGWIDALVRHFVEPDVAAVQGLYVTDPGAPLLARVMGHDLEARYAAVPEETDHVCSGNVAYRASALLDVGGFDERLGYGYDNDVSYRLRQRGYRLLFCRDARSTHRWRAGVSGYLRQQYGFGYGRLDVVAKHPHRAAGDMVSPMLMMAHPVVLSTALIAAAAGSLVTSWARASLTVSLCLIATLILERAAAGARAAVRSRSTTPLWFPAVHLVRDFAWVAAIFMWTARRIAGAVSAPSHSMRARKARVVVQTADMEPTAGSAGVDPVEAPPLLVVIPAFNEALNLRTVIEEIKASDTAIEILVVDDGSTDETAEIVETLGVRWVRLPEQMGVGAAMRVGLRYAVRQRFPVVVRLDGDGQHRADDIPRLVEPVRAGKADMVFGNRESAGAATGEGVAALLKRTLAACLTVLIGRRVADPTCGLSAMGPRAVRLLAERHPTGYPEPELRLLISRTDLRVADVPVAAQSRLSGRTSLTAWRLLGAAARVALAMCVVPFRPIETEPSRD
jgi:glycosyltransferase involved in cell wall biosynthesis